MASNTSSVSGCARRKRKHSSLRSRSSSSDRIKESEKDISFDSQSKIPPCTSTWDVECLESLSIFYDESSCTLSEIMDITGLFPTLTTTLDHLLTIYKTSLTFDLDMQTVFNMEKQTFIDFLEDPIKQAKKSILEMARPCEELHSIAVKPVFDFLDDTSYMLATLRDDIPTEAVFRQFFSSFISMCQLSSKNGEVYKCKEIINEVDVASAPDLRIRCTNGSRVPAVANSMEGVVSIVNVVEVKNIFRGNRSNRDSEYDARVTPSIYESLDWSILGHHGGQLLLEWQSCKKQNRYMPGIILAGSKIFFTVLDMSRIHRTKLRLNEPLDEEETAKIYYTQAFDILKKSDRDILMETFLRLSLYPGI